MEFLFECSIQYLIHEMLSWILKEKFHISKHLTIKKLLVQLHSFKKDWIEQPIVLAPTKLEPVAPSYKDHFISKAYYMPWVK